MAKKTKRIPKKKISSSKSKKVVHKSKPKKRITRKSHSSIPKDVCSLRHGKEREEFIVKEIHIETGGIIVCLLLASQAKQLDLRSGDRVLLKNKKKHITAILDTTHSNATVPCNSIGLFEETRQKLKVKNGQKIHIEYIGKPKAVSYIKKKVHGHPLSKSELTIIIQAFVDDKLTDIEKTAFVMAANHHGFSAKETADLTRAMVSTGSTIEFKNKLVIDKHCIGGVPNNRTTMIVGPIISVAGLTMPKTSSRAITSPAGTADTMECLANVELTKKQIMNTVKKAGVCLIHGGSLNLAPADEKIIDIERLLSIDATGQLLASVMAKKASVGSKIVLIDIPKGPSTKTPTTKLANDLKEKFIALGKNLGIKVHAIITDGRQPIGSGVGPVLEAKDVMRVLKRDHDAPKDLEEKSLVMAGILLELAKKSKKGHGYKMARDILHSGKAFTAMKKIIKLQGKVSPPPLGDKIHHIKAKKSGKIKSIDNIAIASIARVAGAPFDKGAGLYLYKKIGHKVKKGDLLFTIYAYSTDKLRLAKNLVKETKAITY